MASSKDRGTRKGREMWKGLPGTAVQQGDSQSSMTHSRAKAGAEQPAAVQRTLKVAVDTGLSFGNGEVLSGGGM